MFLHGFCKEFVPKEDSQVQKILATREDIFPDYTSDGFKDAFRDSFCIERERLPYRAPNARSIS